MNERIKWIDCAKGFAMFSVVICHVAHGFYSAGLFENHKAFLFAIENIAINNIPIENEIQNARNVFLFNLE